MKQKEDVNHLFHQRFRELVEESGFDVQYFCRIWGISRYQYYNWVNGRGCPDFENLGKIRKTFDVSYEYLLGEIDERHPQNPDANLHPKAQELLQEFREFLKIKFPIDEKKQ